MNQMENRVRKVRAILKTENLDALLISSSYNIRYLTGFAGFQGHEREGYALLTQSSLYIFASPLSSEGARNDSKNSIVVEFSAKKRFFPRLQEIIDKEKLQVIGFEENLTHSEYLRFKKLKNTKFKLSEEIIETVRVTKDLHELKSLQAACALTDGTYSQILKIIRIDMSEKELAWEIEKFIREHGGELGFPTIVQFGINSAIPHHFPADTKLKKNSIVLLDFGAKVDGYIADMSRTFFMGHPSEKFKKMYEAVRRGQELAFSVQEKGNPTPEIIDMIARDYIISQGYPSVPHSVGHGVGLETHELPHITPGLQETIEPNTAFTIEPGIYINGFGGVRIEDTVWWDGNKILSLTKSPKNLIEVV